MRRILHLVCALVLLHATGCATSHYKPAAYKTGQATYGIIALPQGAPIYVCPVIDKLTEGNRKELAADFTPWTYVTEAIEAELKAAGAAPRRPAFSFGPGFVELQKAIREKNKSGETIPYLGTELLVLEPGLWILEARLFSSSGDVLLAKRALCSIGTEDDQLTAHMTLRQILADPAFRRAFQ